MTVRPLQPNTSKAVQTVIVPTQGFVNPFPNSTKDPAKEVPTDHHEDTRGAENGSTTAETRRPINDAPRGVRQQTPGSKREVRFPEARVHREAVHAAVRTAMAEL